MSLPSRPSPRRAAAVAQVLAAADPEGLVALGAPPDEYLLEARAWLAGGRLDGPALREVFDTLFAPAATGRPPQYWADLARRCQVGFRS